MGNRAVICSEKQWAMRHTSGCGIYLHWNGGRDSIEAFLKYCELKRFRDFGWDYTYGYARFVQIVSNFLGGNLSIGVGRLMDLDCEGDNGVYIIGDNWKVVGRSNFTGCEQNYHKLRDMLLEIDKSQPKEEQLGRKFLLAKILPTEKIKLGDKVFVLDAIDNVYGLFPVVQFVNNVPIVARFSDNLGNYAWNPNNHLKESSYRVIRPRKKKEE